MLHSAAQYKLYSFASSSGTNLEFERVLMAGTLLHSSSEGWTFTIPRKIILTGFRSFAGDRRVRYPSIVCQSLRSLTSDLRSVPGNLKIYRDLPARSRTKALPMDGTLTSYFEQIPQLFSAQRAWCKRRVCPATPTVAQ
jgi:hypothetical protein